MKKLGKAALMGLAGGLVAAAMALTGPTAAYAADSGDQLTFAMITHAQPGDAFWDIVRKGAEAAAKQDNVKLLYLSDPTAAKEAQLVTNVIQQHVDGIALTIAFPDAEAGVIKDAQKAGIPIVGFNAGSDDWKKLGLQMYVGQDEKIAGEAVGKRLNTEGAKNVVCVNQQQGAVQLEERCDGIKDTFKGKFEVLYVKGYDMASAQSRIMAKLQQDPSIDYVVTLGAPFAPVVAKSAEMAGSKTKIGTFDMSPQVVSLIKDGKVQFAVDQQPYVEGYLSVSLLWLAATNGDVVGGGEPVLTGPAFVTKANIDAVAEYAKRGTR
jgi:simple sugar transport system substrate-binding protein